MLLLLLVLLPMPGGVLAQRDPDQPDFGSLAAQSGQIFEDDTRIPYRLRLVAAEYEEAIARNQAGAFQSQVVPNLNTRSGLVLVEVAVSGNAPGVLRALQARGLQDSAQYQNRISGFLPIRQLNALDNIREITSVGTNRFERRVGSVTSQADGGMNADDARNLYGVDGSGVTVGTLSDSYNCYAAQGQNPDAADDIATGDLTMPSFVREPSTCGGGTDEGRAMMQLIHDLAPGVTQQFHTANGGESGFANGIQRLANEGSDIIVDDIVYFGEAFFQDDIVAQAAKSVADSGIPYFSAAGNSSTQSYASVFRDSGETFTPFSELCEFSGSQYVLHDFDPSSGVDDTRQGFTALGAVDPILNWDEPHGSISGDTLVRNVGYFVVQAGTNNIVNCANDNYLGANDPIQWGFEIGSSGVEYDFLIGYKADTSAPSYVQYIDLRRTISNAEYWTNSGTSFGHGNTANVVGVGAVDYRFPSFPASFTSRGGIPLFFDTSGNRVIDNRNQPRIAAQQNTDTTFFFPGADPDSTGFPNFAGTSAAAPHAAAVAALMKDCDATLTPAQIYDAMEQSAIDINFAPASSGFDEFTGYGELDAQRAISFIADEIDIQGNGFSILDGSTTSSMTNNTFFGPVDFRGDLTQTFSIENDSTNCGYVELSNNPSVIVSGAHPEDFEVTVQPSDTFIETGEAGTTFSIRFDPTEAGIRTATVIIHNNDPDEGVYTFQIEGQAVPDVNNDGVVSPVDAVEVLNRVGDSSAVSEYDLNGDGFVTNEDVDITIDQHWNNDSIG